MKVLLLNGSPRPQGCTFTALQEVAGALHQQGIETEISQLGTAPVQGCTACRRCSQLGHCVFDDIANQWAQKAKEADAIVLGSPVYYAGPNGAFCAVLDRMFFSSGINLRHKPGASVVSCRRGGSTASLDRLNKYLTITQMPLVSSQYWPMVHGSTPEEVQQDKEGMQTMRVLGQNMAWVLKNLHSGAAPIPPAEPREFTNFIR